MCRTVAFMLDGAHARRGTVRDDDVYVAANMHWEAHEFELPQLPEGRIWHVFANTGMASPHDVWDPGSEPHLQDQATFLMGARSVVILVGR
jgi:glycogen operon protein